MSTGKLRNDDDQLCNNQAFQMPAIGNQEEFVSQKFKVFPNPAKTIISLQLPETDFNKGDISIYDIFGKKVHAAVLTSNKFTFSINISDLSSGMYFIQVQLDDKPLDIQKVIINK